MYNDKILKNFLLITEWIIYRRGPDPFGPGGGPRRRMGGFRGGGGMYI